MKERIFKILFPSKVKELSSKDARIWGLENEMKHMSNKMSSYEESIIKGSEMVNKLKCDLKSKDSEISKFKTDIEKLKIKLLVK